MVMFSSTLFPFLCLLLILLVPQATAQPNFIHVCNNSKGNYTAKSTYETNLHTLLSNLTSDRKHGRSFYNSSYGQNSDKVNAIGWCKGDAKPRECSECLDDSQILLLKLCPYQKEAIIWYDNCTLGYSNRSNFGISPEYSPSSFATNSLNAQVMDQFNEVLVYEAASKYEALSPSSQAEATSPSPPPSLSNGIPSDGISSRIGRISLAVIISIVAAVIIFLVLLNLLRICLSVRNPQKPVESQVEGDKEIEPTETLQVDFDTIKIATNDFSDANRLGQGGFGAVYKGEFNGQEVAVKRLSVNSSQGDTEFKNEVMLLAKLQHRNLVRLLGFCLEGREKILIYEFLPNKSLDFFIFDPSKRAYLDWKNRHKIITGIVRGLLYLHEDSRLRIIHRDLKASNVLLDQEMNPKIADFGLARLLMMDQSHDNTARIVGTYGYMAPEYVGHGLFSVKSDVFSLGVLILEIICGCKNGRPSPSGQNVEHLPSIAWKSWREETASYIIDPTLEEGPRDQIVRCINIGLLCVQENTVNRPTMTSIAQMLNSNVATDLPMPSQPAFFMNGISPIEPDNPEGQSSVYDETSITEQYPR